MPSAKEIVKAGKIIEWLNSKDHKPNNQLFDLLFDLLLKNSFNLDLVEKIPSAKSPFSVKFSLLDYFLFHSNLETFEAFLNHKRFSKLKDLKHFQSFPLILSNSVEKLKLAEERVELIPDVENLQRLSAYPEFFTNRCILYLIEQKPDFNLGVSLNFYIKALLIPEASISQKLEGFSQLLDRDIISFNEFLLTVFSYLEAEYLDSYKTRLTLGFDLSCSLSNLSKLIKLFIEKEKIEKAEDKFLINQYLVLLVPLTFKMTSFNLEALDALVQAATLLDNKQINKKIEDSIYKTLPYFHARNLISIIKKYDLNLDKERLKKSFSLLVNTLKNRLESQLLSMADLFYFLDTLLLYKKLGFEDKNIVGELLSSYVYNERNFENVLGRLREYHEEDIKPFFEEVIALDRKALTYLSRYEDFQKVIRNSLRKKKSRRV